MARIRQHNHPTQLTLAPILRQSRRVAIQAITLFCLDNRDQYQQWAAWITPRSDMERAWRICFAILSAHEHFEKAAQAYTALRTRLAEETIYFHQTQFNLAIRIQGLLHEASIMRAPEKAQWCASILRFAWAAPQAWSKNQWESWDQYALRIRAWPGLHDVKSQFAAALCYPTESNNACLDTHMMAWLFGKRGKAPTSREYKRALRWFRALAKRCGITGFLAQWMTWDWCRGTREDHAFLR